MNFLSKFWNSCLHQLTSASASIYKNSINYHKQIISRTVNSEKTSTKNRITNKKYQIKQKKPTKQNQSSKKKKQIKPEIPTRKFLLRRQKDPQNPKCVQFISSTSRIHLLFLRYVPPIHLFTAENVECERYTRKLLIFILVTRF